jgi:hypothetical protein
MALIGGLGVAQAQTLGTAQTYSNIVFSFSTTLKSGSADYTVCNELRVDATGDFVHSTKFVVYGVLNCASSATGYTAAGSGYIGFNGSINMSLLLGTGLYLQCPTLVNLVGNCDINNAAGVKVGSASLAVK